MKKLYFLDESEKERILKLHESHTKKQYLMSEQQMMADIASGVAAGALYGGGLGAAGLGVGAIPGAIIGGSIGLISALFNTTARPDFKKQITKVCESGKLGNPIDDAKLDTITAELKKLISTTNIMGAGRATKASQEGIKKQLSRIASVPDFCQVINRYKENYNKDLLDQLSGEFYMDDAWNTYVRLPLMVAVRKTEQISKNADASKSGANVPDNWKSYPCVPKSQGVTPVKDIEGKTIISYKRYSESKNKNITYQPDGTYWWEGMVERRYYKCNGNNIVDAQDYSALDSKKESAGVGVVTRNVQAQIPELMKMAGMEGQPINQDTINKLYDILSKK